MPEHFHACARCGQTVITRADPPVCHTCRALERAPVAVHVQDQMFTLPDVMRGQLSIPTDEET